jgi:hypothetical protein
MRQKFLTADLDTDAIAAGLSLRFKLSALGRGPLASSFRDIALADRNVLSDPPKQHSLVSVFSIKNPMPSGPIDIEPTLFVRFQRLEDLVTKFGMDLKRE